MARLRPRQGWPDAGRTVGEPCHRLASSSRQKAPARPPSALWAMAAAARNRAPLGPIIMDRPPPALRPGRAILSGQTLLVLVVLIDDGLQNNRHRSRLVDAQAMVQVS